MQYDCTIKERGGGILGGAGIEREKGDLFGEGSITFCSVIYPTSFKLCFNFYSFYQNTDYGISFLP